MNYAFKDETGKKFGRLQVIKLVSSGRIGAHWLCICDCGREKVATGHNLRRGQIQSCGCFHRELARLRGKALPHGVIKHGHARRGSPTREYQCWQAIHRRCYNIRNARWEDYGGRGIKVGDRWHKFENFLTDMGERPSPLHSLDRIDNDGDYTPENCRWTTLSEQQSNKSRAAKASDLAILYEYEKRFWNSDDPRLWEANYA
jgi:hypothetical protein